MTFKEIYDRIIPLWGNRIDFSDGIKSKPENALDTPGTSPSGNNYFYSSLLTKQWDKIEEEIGHIDTYGDLMVWTMYQVFHRHSKRLFQADLFELVPREIVRREIESEYFSNLSKESWEKELSMYKREIQ